MDAEKQEKLEESGQSSLKSSPLKLNENHQLNHQQKFEQKPFFTSLHQVGLNMAKDMASGDAFLNIQPSFNPAASPWVPRKNEGNPPLLIGPSKVQVNSRIWETIKTERSLPALPRMMNPTAVPNLPMSSRQVVVERVLQQPPYFSQPLSQPTMLSGFSESPTFDEPYHRHPSRNIVFTRSFGPVAHPGGYVELRLRENITVYLCLDRTIYVNNPNSRVTMAVSSNMMTASLNHPNGKVFQHLDRVDIMAYSGTKKSNNYVRYAKMWEKGVSLTANGCALIYLVDAAGTRTTSDAVNKDIHNDYCGQVFVTSSRLGSQYYCEAEAASKNYHYFTQDDGTQVFEILGYRISQTQDGMLRISRSQGRLKLHTSPSNGSAALTTPNIHCTASMGTSSHLFVRRDERRMHFDGSSFVVRNAGHSAGFNENNNLCVY